jgi:hypothetical protein
MEGRFNPLFKKPGLAGTGNLGESGDTIPIFTFFS